MERLPEKQFSSPEEEIAFLRKEIVRNREAGNVSALDTVRRYSVTPSEKILSSESIVNDNEAHETAANLKAETSEEKVQELIAMIPEKGIKNTIAVAEKLNDPHLFDDLHRSLVSYIASGQQINLTEKDALWKPLHMTLFEVNLPDVEEGGREKSLTELISGMEQFYSGMISVAEDNKRGSWFTIEIAKENNQSDFSFYISVPSENKRLLEKQILSIFPSANILERPNDYNIFNESGVSVGATASLAKHSLYPLRSYQDFDVDPLSVLLNGFSKIDKEGEGAAIQLMIGSRQDNYADKARGAIESIRAGEDVKTALSEMDKGVASKVAREIFSVFKSAEAINKEKDKKTERAGQVDNALLEQFNNKLKTPAVAVSLRVAASSRTEQEASAILSDLIASFNQFENSEGNNITWKKTSGRKQEALLRDFSLRNWNQSEVMTWNLEETTTIIHLPSAIGGKVAPSLRQVKSASAPAPSNLPVEGTILGINDFRGIKTEVKISDEDRLRHFYIIGQTGTGKTTLMKNMLVQDIEAGHGVCFIDPHGTDIADILGSIPEHRKDDVIYFDPARLDRVIGLNMLEFDERFPEQKTFVVNELFSIFQKLYGAVPESMGPMFEQYFRNATLLVLEDPASGSTMLDIARVFADANYRRMKLKKAKNPVVIQFWTEIATKAGGEASLENIIPYITSKFDVFTANDFMRPIIGQQNSSFNFRQLMDEKKILLVNLSKGRLGEINANLIGMIIVGKILMAALSRVDDMSKGYPNFFLHMDEFQNITTDSISAILSEARKYKLGLTVAHQFIAQLDEKIKDAVFGNVGSIATFRVGPEDSEFLEKQFSPIFTSKDLMNIENRQAFLRILADGTPQKPFNIHTLPPKEVDINKVNELIDYSYQRYAKPRRQIEMDISSRFL